jgi:hypothetical protein
MLCAMRKTATAASAARIRLPATRVAPEKMRSAGRRVALGDAVAVKVLSS